MTIAAVLKRPINLEVLNTLQCDSARRLSADTFAVNGLNTTAPAFGVRRDEPEEDECQSDSRVARRISMSSSNPL